MADLTIRLKTSVDGSGAEQEVAKLKEKLEKKEVNLKFDTTKMKSQMEELQKVLNNAFKLKDDQLNNLKQIQNTLKEINSLSKDVQKNLFGNGSTKTSTGNKELDNTIAKYKVLQKQSESLQKQMSKTINTQAYNELEAKLSKINSEMQSTAQKMDNLKNKSNIDISRDLISSFDKIQQKANNTSEQINNMFKNKNLTSTQIEQLQELQNKINNVKGADLSQILKSDKAYEQIHNLNAEISNVSVSLKGLNGSITFTDKVNTSVAKLESLKAKLAELGTSKFANTSGIQELITQIEQYQSKLRNIDPNTEGAKAEFDGLKDKIAQCENKYKQFESEISTKRANVKFDADFNKVSQDLTNLTRRCQELGASSSKIEEFKQRLQTIASISNLKDRDAELKALTKDVSTFSSSLSNINGNGINGVTNSARSATQAMNILGNTTRKTSGFFSSLSSMLSMYSIPNMFARVITQGISSIPKTIVDTDTAIKKLLKVAPDTFTGTAKQLDWLTQKASEAGQEVARSSIDIIDSTAEALQSGFHNVSKALEYAKNASMFANVIDIDQASADKYLKSTLASYGGVANSLDKVTMKVKGNTKETTRMMQMMDMVNYANNNYAVTGKDVSEAMMRSASVAKTLGVNMQELVGIIIAGQEPLQNASKLGNGLKTIMQNMAGWKTSAKDGSISMNKTAMAIEKITGIDMHDSNGQVRDFYDIMGDIAGMWDKLDKKSKSSVAEAIAGKIIFATHGRNIM